VAAILHKILKGMRKSIMTCAVVIICYSLPIKTLASDSTKVKIRTLFTTSRLLDIRQDTFISVDSNLDLFEQFNPSVRYDNFYRHLGNTGSATKSIAINIQPLIGFDLGLHQFDPYIINKENIKFYNTHTPYSEFGYVQGKNEVQKFSVLHARNITAWWNICVFYTNLTSDGFYYNSKAKHTIFGASTWAHTRNYRYAVYLSAIKNKFRTGENGGITDDSTFAAYKATEKLYMVIWLNSAKQDYIFKDYSLTQILNLGRSDTNLLKKKIFPYKNQFYFKYNIHFAQQEYLYGSDFDIDTAYYKQIFDSSRTNDGVKSWQLENDLSFNANSGRIRKDGLKDFNFKPGIRYQYINLTKDSTTDSIIQNISFNFVIDKYFYFSRLFVEGNYIFSGPDAGNMYAQGYLKFFLPFDFMLRPGLIQSIKSPTYIQNHAHTKYFRWNNDFNPISTTNLFAGLFNSKYKFFLNVNYYLINDYVYFDENINPVQESDPLSYFSAELNKELKLGKFHFNNHIIYQKELSQLKVMNLPSWIIQNSTYYENIFFKKALHLKIGFDIRMQDAYYADSYYAPYSIFYNQSYVKVKTYPVFDLFVSATIKRMRIFIKYEHLNQELFPDYPSYNYPHYPSEPRVLRYGFTWLFFD
jgi:hypothetical protein